MKRLFTFFIVLGLLAGINMFETAGAKKNSPVKTLPAPLPSGVLAFDQTNDIVTQELSDGTFRKLTNDAVFDGNPSWSPDGTKVAYASNQAGDTSLFVRNADGTGTATRITTPPAFSGDYHPDWGTDGQVRFYREDYNGQGRDGLYVVNSDGSGLTLLIAGKGLYDPALSPDGSKIAYSVTNQATGRSDIVVKTLSTGTTVTLTASEGETVNRFPSWDGNSALYFQSGLNNPTIKRIDLNTGTVTTINLPVPARHPAAGPDGWFAYATGTPASSQIGIHHLATGEGAIITSPSQYTGNPAWHWTPVGKKQPVKTVR